MIEHENDRGFSRHILDTNYLNAPEIDAHRKSKNGNDNSASHWNVSRPKDSNLLDEDWVRIVSLRSRVLGRLVSAIEFVVSLKRKRLCRRTVR